MEKVVIFPRSPRETMNGWVHLPRFIDKIRLHIAGRLADDYRENFTNGFDGQWLKAAGVSAEQFIEVVKNSITDGEVCEWVRRHIQKTDAEKSAFANFVVNRGKENDPAIRERLESRKKAIGIAHRTDIQTFVDLIDADEGRI
jgi:hypothetical protein